MFERFTDRARKCVVLAQEEAIGLQHHYIGTEHLLLGLMKEGDGVAAKALKSLNISTESVREQVVKSLGKGKSGTQEKVPFTPRAKKVLEYSLREALSFGHNYIGTEHILLGLLREGEGVAANALKELGADLEKVRESVTSLLDNDQQTASKRPEGKGSNRRKPTGTKQGSKKILDKFGKNLTQQALENQLDPVIGRTNEIERVVQILSRRTKNNPVLVGEPGVGKTAIVEGLAQLIAKNQVPDTMVGKQIYTLDLGSVVAGSRYRGDFEDRIKKVLAEIRANGNIILFIDEIHTLVGAGAAEGAIDASSMLKPMLARGEIQTIGATTTEDIPKTFRKRLSIGTSVSAC